MSATVKDFDFKSEREWYQFFGRNEENIKLIEKSFQVKITARGGRVSITGQEADVQRVSLLLDEIYGLLSQGYTLKKSDIEFSIRMVKEGNGKVKEVFSDGIYISAKKKMVTPKSENQKKYLEAIKSHDIVFGIGPAGTGKTYLAVAMAVSALAKREVERIVITRPAVEAGEKLGFLPGDLVEKVSPYLRPIYDALFDLVGFDRAERFLDKGIIEVAPLAFMRGRTLSNAFVILDEAQNTTSEQMKMFLTRLGYDSKAVITGDITQIDLPKGTKSGLVEALDVLKDIEGIAFVFFDEKDVVRHPLVRRIIKAYEERELQKGL
ncbi:phosphate starvation-inducible protein PhoH and related proteins [Thermosulfidibacter takaii ABI70S6]|uniref:PhoH-like protein n=1 Tax=Thermosulfidibacter takaii (strain DSM 17441 / JCM 13301 / NBRC 103674 / ABI70S6) TaxID=1298851 RepID=A0A0S3QV15_THET7|nr:PhoH family protein [Thermosulfidibacter takaii]BAT72189.1 phosphate starvation-inducible protein PhoH and related proteins [Thermosulfidibacter takaii ABI70S6]